MSERKRIVVLASDGMAGHVIVRHFNQLQQFSVTAINENDLFDVNYQMKADAQRLLGTTDYIINCARCLIEEAEQNPAKAIAVNSYLPKLLEKIFFSSETKIIHLSTDCVFSGANGPYEEKAKPDGTSYYSRTKALGEIENSKDLTIRTSYIGPTLGSFREELFDWFMHQEGDIKGFADAHWTGITTLALAKNIELLLEKKVSGTYHLVPSSSISKYELLLLIQKIFSKEDVSIYPDTEISTNRWLIDTRKDVQVANYSEMFTELHFHMKKHQGLYQKYVT